MGQEQAWEAGSRLLASGPRSYTTNSVQRKVLRINDINDAVTTLLEGLRNLLAKDI